MQFFQDCASIEEVKAIYKKLAKQHHPDHGGDTATMQAINSEYAAACVRILKGGELNAEEVEAGIQLSEEYRQVIEKISNLDNITIEIVGLWIWVTGNTFRDRKELKEAGLFFASKKRAWYYRTEAFKSNGSQKTLDEIRSKYGSEPIFRNQSRQLLD